MRIQVIINHNMTEQHRIVAGWTPSQAEVESLQCLQAETAAK